MAAVKNGAERVFREDTIRLLTKLDVRTEQLIASHEDQKATVERVAKALRAETKDANEALLDALTSHSKHDDHRFDDADEQHNKLAKLVNRGVGGLAVLQFIIIAGIAIWQILAH